MKKAQGLSLNTIIIAAIVLIVLIVLWAIFTGRMGKFGSGVVTTQKCEEACRAIGSESPKTATKENCGPPSKYLGTNFVFEGKKMAPGTGCCCS